MKYWLFSLHSCPCDLASGLWHYTLQGWPVSLSFMSMVAALFAYKAAFHFTLPFTHRAPAILAFSRLLQLAQLTPTTGPLHQLLPSPWSIPHLHGELSVTPISTLVSGPQRNLSTQLKLWTQSLWISLSSCTTTSDISLPTFACLLQQDVRSRHQFFPHRTLPCKLLSRE